MFIAAVGVVVCGAIGMLVLGAVVSHGPRTRPVTLPALSRALAPPEQPGFRSCLTRQIGLEHVLTEEGLARCQREFGPVPEHTRALARRQLDLIERSLPAARPDRPRGARG